MGEEAGRELVGRDSKFDIGARRLVRSGPREKRCIGPRVIACTFFTRRAVLLVEPFDELEVFPEGLKRLRRLVQLEVRPKPLGSPRVDDDSVWRIEIRRPQRCPRGGRSPRVSVSFCGRRSPGERDHLGKGNAGPQAAKKVPASDLRGGTHVEISFGGCSGELYR